MKIAVFCGSSIGENPEFAQATRALGHYLATNGVDLVYGGGNVGLMGVVADAFLEKGASSRWRSGIRITSTWRYRDTSASALTAPASFSLGWSPGI